MFPLLLVPAIQSPVPIPKPFAAVEFLLGAWEGEGGGVPGHGTGTFTFALELQGKVMVRRNHSEYPATKDRPASDHEDLMVVFNEGGKLRAHYYDNEGHVILYQVSPPDEKGGVQFISDAQAGPRFRLTYTPAEKDRLLLRFDIAPPGRPDAFKNYIEAGAKRKS